MPCPNCQSESLTEISSWSTTPAERSTLMVTMRMFPPHTLLGLAAKAALPVVKGLATRMFQCNKCRQTFRKW